MLQVVQLLASDTAQLPVVPALRSTLARVFETLHTPAPGGFVRGGLHRQAAAVCWVVRCPGSSVWVRLDAALVVITGKSQWLFLLYESFFFMAFFGLAFLALQFKNHAKR